MDLLAFLMAFLLTLSGGCRDQAAVSGSSGEPTGSAVEEAAGPPVQERELIIDSHVHLYPTFRALVQTLEIFDRAGIGRFVLKSAGEWGTAKFDETLAMKKMLGDRMEFFCNIGWKGVGEPGFIEEKLDRLTRARDAGARGVKIFKNLGLTLRKPDGTLYPVDDPYLDPIFTRAGELGLIVAIHTADPVAFFKPPTPDNERWEELSLAPDWSFYGKDYPGHDELLAQRDRVIERHPEVRFLLIHLANYPENLDYVDKLLERFPNIWVDTSARVPEFGRHPADQVRAFFIKHQDRILFGSDFISTSSGMQLGSVSLSGPPTLDDGVEFFRRHWEYFETDKKGMDHPTPSQGRWKVDGIHLPPEVLDKLYRKNAELLIFSSQPK